MSDLDNFTHDLPPLREPTFYILLSLSSGEKHGYAILKEVEEHSGGTVVLSTSTLYEALARLREQNLIERVDAAGEDGPGEPHPGRPRKAYRLTPRGMQVLKAEAQRLRRLASAAQRLLSEDALGGSSFGANPLGGESPG
jgi:DNA-binding PadR family transcriptional regulator